MKQGLPCMPALGEDLKEGYVLLRFHLVPVTLWLLVTEITAGCDHYSSSDVSRMASGILARRKSQNSVLGVRNKGTLNTLLMGFYDIFLSHRVLFPASLL